MGRIEAVFGSIFFVKIRAYEDTAIKQNAVVYITFRVPAQCIAFVEIGEGRRLRTTSNQSCTKIALDALLLTFNLEGP